MAVTHIPETEAARDLTRLLARVRAGEEIVIEREASSDVKKHAKELGYEPRMDPAFAADLEEIIRNRKPWNPPAWE